MTAVDSLEQRLRRTFRIVAEEQFDITGEDHEFWRHLAAVHSRRLFSPLIVSLAVAVVVAGVALGVAYGPGGSTPSGRQHQTQAAQTLSRLTGTTITSSGRLLWDFEALLRRSFGNRQPWVDGTSSGYLNFDCSGDCSPLSTYFPYSYTFSNPMSLAFHISKQNYHGWSFGNYPEPVLINGMIIACNSQESTFLIRYSDTSSFTLACIAPLSRS
jgi:hypothetical protein